jgi:clan AA aspartic protease (TIGR02281 family)
MLAASPRAGTFFAARTGATNSGELSMNNKLIGALCVGALYFAAPHAHANGYCDQHTVANYDWDQSTSNAQPVPTTMNQHFASFSMVDGAMYTRANIGGHWFTMVVDTGASMASINETFANELMVEHHATEYKPVAMSMADGSTHQVRTIAIDRLWVGHDNGYDASNVQVSVTPDDADCLLALPLLNSLGKGKFSIDLNVGKLTFG